MSKLKLQEPTENSHAESVRFQTFHYFWVSLKGETGVPLRPGESSNRYMRNVHFRSSQLLVMSRTLLVLALLMVTAASGCGYTRGSREPQDTHETRSEEKVRDQAAKATERAKPELQWLARNLGYLLKRAGELASAAAQGVWQGWHSSGNQVIDVNSASETELLKLPGVTREDARKIAQHRPYRDKRELVSKGVLSESEYTRIRDEISLK